MMTNLIDRVRFLFSKDKALASSLYKILGFYPHDIEIYRIALSHKSAAYKSNKGKYTEKPVNNERLEFLGDAILEAVVSDIVYHRYEKKREGFLTSTRSKIVQRSSLNHLATEIGLDELVRIAAPPQTHNSNIGGNAFEALTGAIYLDRGYKYCKWFIEKRILNRLVNIDDVAKREINFKSKLLEWSQKNRIQIEYTFTQHDQPGSSSPEFSSTVWIEGIAAGNGEGFSKKESHQNAAKDALVRMRSDQRFYDNLFRAKEKRTAMEVSEICVLPQIDEVEAEIKRRENDLTQRKHSAKRAPQRPDTTPIRTFTPSRKKSVPGTEEKADDKSQKPQTENKPADGGTKEKSADLRTEPQKAEIRKSTENKEKTADSRRNSEEKKGSAPIKPSAHIRTPRTTEESPKANVSPDGVQGKDKDAASTTNMSLHHLPAAILTDDGQTIPIREKDKENSRKGMKTNPASSDTSAAPAKEKKDIPFKETGNKASQKEARQEKDIEEKRNNEPRKPRPSTRKSQQEKPHEESQPSFTDKEGNNGKDAAASTKTSRVRPYTRRSSNPAPSETDIESLISQAEEEAYREEAL